jgi:TonB family protein
MLAATAAMAAMAATAAMGQAPADPRVGQTRQAELNTWKRYTIKGEQVSASLPTHPAMTTGGRYREETKQELTDRMVGAYADGVVYAIYTYDNPKPRDTFEHFLAHWVGMDQSHISNVRTVKMGRYPGKEYSSANPASPWTMQIYAVEDRFYKFLAFNAPANDPAVKQFFVSIALNKKGGIEVSDGPGAPFIDAGAGKIFTGKDVDQRARLVMKPEPRYTEDARKAGIAGTVILKVVFASNGSVTNIRTMQGLPYGLTEQAIDSARKIKFIPAVKDGKYASVWMQLEYNFNLY